VPIKFEVSSRTPYIYGTQRIVISELRLITLHATIVPRNDLLTWELVQNVSHGMDNLPANFSQGAPSLSTLIFHDFSMTKKMKIHDLSAHHIFPSKRYTTYECIPELVVTVPSARNTIVKKIKRFII